MKKTTRKTAKKTVVNPQIEELYGEYLENPAENELEKALAKLSGKLDEYNGPQEMDHIFQMNREHGKINQRKRKEFILCHEGNTHRNIRPRSFWRYSRESGS